MSQRLKQFLPYLKAHDFKFSVQKVLDETSMNRAIFYKVMAELRKIYDVKHESGIYTVTKKEGGSMSERKLPNYLSQVLELVRSKGDAGADPAETGRILSGFRACISMLRSEGYRIDFKDDRYYFKGTGDFSLSYTKGVSEPKKVWGKKILPQKRKVVEQVEQKVVPVGTPFVINYEVLNPSLKGAPKQYVSFIKEVVKKVQAANSAYEAVQCIQFAMTNMYWRIQKAKAEG